MDADLDALATALPCTHRRPAEVLSRARPGASASGHEHLGGDVAAHADEFEQLRRGRSGQRLQPPTVHGDLLVQLQPLARQRAQHVSHRRF